MKKNLHSWIFQFFSGKIQLADLQKIRLSYIFSLGGFLSINEPAAEHTAGCNKGVFSWADFLA